MRSYTVKENRIGSAVSEILRYKLITDRQIEVLLLYHKDMYIVGVEEVNLHLKGKYYLQNFSNKIYFYTQIYKLIQF